MLLKAMQYCNNYFVTAIHKGNIVIDVPEGEGALITVNDVALGDLISVYTPMMRLIGSHNNYEMLDASNIGDLLNDKFIGEIWELAPPQEFIELCDKIRLWNADNEPSNLTSESFGGYSYSRATNDKGIPLTWQDVFAKDLRKYKKI